jgi:tetratricopeptide (TPR) repeat protein
MPQEKHCYALKERYEAEQLARRADDKKNVQAAIGMMDEAKSLDDDNSIMKDISDITSHINKIAGESLVELGRDLIEADQDAEAIKRFRQAHDYVTSIDPEKSAAATFKQVGLDLLQQGKIPEAVDDFGEARAHDHLIDMKEVVTALVSKGNGLIRSNNVKQDIPLHEVVKQAIPLYGAACTFDSTLNSPNKLAADALVVKGNSLASQGDIKHAVEAYVEANKLDPNKVSGPQLRANDLAAKALVRLALRELPRGLVTVVEAVRSFSDAARLDEKAITADNWNDFCWFGALLEHPSDVMYACDRAVELSPNDWQILDSRGLARAVAGDRQRAIADLTIVVARNKQPTPQNTAHRVDQSSGRPAKTAVPAGRNGTLRKQYGVQIPKQ